MAALGYVTSFVGHSMPETIAITLAALWLLGLVSSHTMGGYIHALLAIAVVAVMIPVIHDEALEPEPPDILR